MQWHFVEQAETRDDIELFKLLYALDFEHFRQTGRSVTGLIYEAWRAGPVPTQLLDKLPTLKADLAESRGDVAFDAASFTPEQLAMMETLRQRYQKNASRLPIDVTHEQNGAWSKIWDGGKGERDVIPYALAIRDDDPNRDLILESALEACGLARPLDEGEY